jgi:hypothetical protein
MANLMEDIVSYYTELGLVSGLGVDAFVDMMPEKPHRCMSVLEYPGLPQPSYTEVATRSVQILNRDPSSEVARERALDLYNGIVPYAQRQDLTNTRWSLIEPKQTPFKLKVDAQGRTYYVFNLEIITFVDYN